MGGDVLMGLSETKAALVTEQGDRIPCVFNPAEFTVSKSTSWQAPEAKGKNAPDLRFQAGQPGTMTLSLTLDTTDSGEPVTIHTDKLFSLLAVNSQVQGADPARNAARPPWVKFTWGSFTSYQMVVERLQVRFTFFTSDGTPLRARADLSLKQFADTADHPYQNPTSRTPTLQTLHHTTGGETLDRIAATHYANHALWRVIAEANRVEDPLRIPAGTVLVIPELPGRSRG
jgi:nucleoid-associated protein YgaU